MLADELRQKREAWDLDTWGVVINGPRTYFSIAQALRAGRSVAMGWTDGRSTLHGLLFATDADRVTFVPGINRAAQLHEVMDRVLFVSVLRVGAFGFVMDGEQLHPDYVGEKLGTGSSVTSEALAALINGVMQYMREGD